MKVRAAAKINLTLDVVGRLENGYHELESVFQTVDICDEVSVELDESGEGIYLTCDSPDEFGIIPCDERNIAYKAASRFMDENGISARCDIHIKKGIPSQAGMGGGSTDAAAVIYCLQRLTGKTLKAPEKLGADVPFFLTGGTAYVCGIGERISPAPDYSGRVLVIAKGRQGVSTAEAYSRIDSLTAPIHPDTKAFMAALESGSGDEYKYFGNLFEQAIKLDEVDTIKRVMSGSGALGAAMTGSGSAVFGLFASQSEAGACAALLRSEGFFAQVCKTVPTAFSDAE